MAVTPKQIDSTSEQEESRTVHSKLKQCGDSEERDSKSELEESRAVDSKLKQ